MKKIFYLLFCLASASVSAQAPQGIPYQAIARNASGVAIANTAVKVRFSIRDSIATGKLLYREAHYPTTSSLGLFTVNIGQGTFLNGSFSGINWNRNNKFLQVELDPAGGSAFIDLGTTQMMTVPFSLSAGNGLPSGGSNGQVLAICNGKPEWTTGGICPSVTTLNCAGAVFTYPEPCDQGNFTVSIPYTGGNGKAFSSQSVTYTVHPYFNANLNAGILANGSGNLIWKVSGLNSYFGANLSIGLGDKTCSFSLLSNDVITPSFVSSLNCSSATISANSTVAGNPVQGLSISIPYSGGNGGLFGGNVNSTGVTGLTAIGRNRCVQDGSGTVTWDVSGVPSAGGNAVFSLYCGSKTCTLSVPVASGTVSDVDGNNYNVTVIGGKLWMKENLKVSKYRNGNSIPLVSADTSWSKLSTGAYAYYNNNASNNAVYGKIYNGYAVGDTRGLCPNGWHLPSDAEWKAMETSLGVSSGEIDLMGDYQSGIADRGASVNAGGRLKSISSLWNPPNTGATNESGFSGQPGGRRTESGPFSEIQSTAYWWTSDLNVNRFLTSNYQGIYARIFVSQKDGMYVRCVKD
jgi:uncharacterized protein (TIGR02145 family)